MMLIERINELEEKWKADISIGSWAKSARPVLADCRAELVAEKARADAAEARLAPALEALKASMWFADGDLPLAEYEALLVKAGVL